MIITSDNRYKSNLKEFKKFETTNMSPNIKILWKKGSGVHIFDKYNKTGYLIQRGKYYIFQPFDDIETVSLASRKKFTFNLDN